MTLLTIYLIGVILGFVCVAHVTIMYKPKPNEWYILLLPLLSFSYVYAHLFLVFRHYFKSIRRNDGGDK